MDQFSPGPGYHHWHSKCVVNFCFSRLFFKNVSVCKWQGVRVHGMCVRTHVHTCVHAEVGRTVKYGRQGPWVRSGKCPAHVQHLPLLSPMSVSLRHLLRGGISRGNIIPIPALKGCRKKSTLTLKLKDLVLVTKRPGSKWKANRMNTKGDNVKSVLLLALCRAWFTSLLQQRQIWGPGVSTSP